MDGQPVAADSKHLYPTQLWTRSISSSSVPRLSTLPATNTQELAPAQCATHLDLVPILFPQQSSLYQAKLLQYNKLIAPGRGGGLQTPPLPPILSSQPVHAGAGSSARSRSLSKVSNKESRARQSSQNCHGNRSNQNTTKADRVLMTGKVTNSKMPPKKPDVAHGLPPKPKTSVSPSHLPHSNSVPSTPHQHARKFSFESREQSPGANQSHSPRSVYSETNGALPSLRPLPPRTGGCKYETGLKFSRRRIPYSIGTDPLDRLDLNSVQSKLSEDDERKLTTDMRELYDRLQPTDAVETKRLKLVQKLEEILNTAWPGHDIRVHLFGSSGNLLCSDDSDVDICIVTPWKELEGICMLADLLAKHGMERVVCVASAKVPIVKIWDPELELSCDMNVNNTLALENTRMIKTYVHIDDRVRPLAMIIKYWTRQRILNDAGEFATFYDHVMANRNLLAFGGTLSSYTWICMIIAFLQLRQPPVLPALHQRPHQKLPRQDGEIAAFADDIDSLRGFGEKNKSTLGELLFEFFRFFAHEFDYSSNALSVRLGKIITKHEKKWHLALNNQLCVEEPFNTNRNLGNTADDTAFRGIHLELRRAFDAIAKGSLDECCEQFVYPKEEERIFQKPPPVSRPVLLRSASQQQPSRPGRGGSYRNGGRHQNRNNGNHNSNNNNSRRASSGLTYENTANPMYVPAAYAMALSGQDATSMYMQSPELVAQISALQLQENNLRFLQYTQSQAFAQQQALQHAQRMQGTAPQSQSSTERSRTNSFDTPPLSAPIRPDIRPEMYYYQMPIHQAQAFYGFTTYPSAPSNMAGADYRRSNHRSTTASEANHGSSGSTIRSHSQPASRPIAVAPSGQNLGIPSQMPNGFTSVPARHISSIPSFIPDEANDNEQDGSTTDSPDDGKSSSYYTNPSSPRRASGATNGMPAFGDIGAHSEGPAQRHSSSDEFAQPMSESTFTGSRSPSPPNQETAYLRSGNPTPLVTATSPPKQLNRETAPLVVNGSKSRPVMNSSPRQAWYGETMAAADLTGYENPLHIHQDSISAASQSVVLGPDQSPTPWKANSPSSDRPMVVNGSRPTSGLTTPPHPGSIFTNDAVTLNPEGAFQIATWPTGTVPVSHAIPQGRLPTTLQRFPRPVPSPLIAQLDLATETSLQANDLHHLSPVYETKSPSPSFTRKLELPLGESSDRTMHSSQRRREGALESSRLPPKSLAESPTPEAEGSSHANPRINGLIRENGHMRGAKSESDNNAGANGAWQKPRGRKRVNELKGRGEALSQSEQPPKNDADRKGG
ncbi:hypothetical protein EKO27_g11608 [Xylaria grammica]|uniref:polynucleotide adenylyltransferase n=1 Tax=Xylaria grammica TaxID=363999 RepID=A0A439CMW8_9PEZI|nr:hypothetical protein EKO27_g11608 [Xylaria grammica]